jgi:hypothetical protein
MTQSGYSPSRAAERAGEVTAVIGEQAKQTASEAGTQAKNLLDEGMNQLRGQARDGQQKLAGSVRNVADQLRRMSDRTDDSGMASDLVRQATDRADQVASWLESREPGDVVDEVRRFARRRPGMFLAGATLAGVLAGRLTRNVAASAQDSGPDRERDWPNPSGAEPGRRTQGPAPAGTTEPESPDFAPGGAGYPPQDAGYPQQVPPPVPVVPPAGPVR